MARACHHKKRPAHKNGNKLSLKRRGARPFLLLKKPRLRVGDLHAGRPLFDWPRAHFAGLRLAKREFVVYTIPVKQPKTFSILDKGNQASFIFYAERRKEEERFCGCGCGFLKAKSWITHAHIRAPRSGQRQRRSRGGWVVTFLVCFRHQALEEACREAATYSTSSL